MRTRHLLGLLVILLLVLAVWLVPMALAAAGGSTAPDDQAVPAQSSGTQCPFLEAHPWLDPHGSGGAGAATGAGASSEIEYY